jgi:hypothetical protein
MGLFTRDGADDGRRRQTEWAGSDGPPPLDRPRTLTASAQRLRLDDRRALEALRAYAADGAATWQARAWAAYESTGEIHFAFNLVGNIVSRIRFYPAAEVSPNVAPAFVGDVDDLTPGLADAALAAVRRLQGGGNDLSSMARSLALNLSVPGEAYLVQVPPSTVLTPTGLREEPESWQVRSRDEVIVPSDPESPVLLRSRRSERQKDLLQLPPTAFVGRILRSSPRYSGEPDSSMRAVLDLVDELLLLNQTFRATARSRLNSGLLFVPDGMSASTPAAAASAPSAAPGDPAAPDPSGLAPLPPDPGDEFEEALIEGMMTPVSDPADASAVVPILVRGPAELGEKILLIRFERSFDPSLVQRADRVLERILQGLDLPKDVVSGMASVRYSNAVTIEDSFFKAHVEPLTLLICDAITDVYLRPALEAMGYTAQQAARVRMWYDPSEVVSRPNRNQDAVAAFDRYALSARSLREANGFNESDAPSSSELILRMLLQKGPMTPDLAEALMRSIAPLMMGSAKDAAQAASDTPLPPEVMEMLGGSAPGGPAAEPPAAPAEPPPEEPAAPEEAPPAPPAPPAPGAPPAPPAAEPRGPRGGRPAAEVDLGDGVSLLPPRPGGPVR